MIGNNVVRTRSMLAIGGAVLAIVIGAGQPIQAKPLLPALQSKVPNGYDVLANVEISAGTPVRRFVVVALGRRDEGDHRDDPKGAPNRPLIIFEQVGGQYRQVARNDTVVLAADAGGQCDPFLDNDGTIAVKGGYFTVENGVACGSHWTDYITFRFDDRAGGFVFDNERNESWSMNRSTKSDAEALVRDGPQRVRRDRAGRVTPFSAWRPLP